MTAVYDFFRFIKLYSTDGTTLEHTIEADAVTDTLSISRGAGVSWTPASSATDSFKIDVNYQLEVPVSTTTLRLTDVNSVDQDIALVAGTNMNIVRDNANQLTISSLVGGISKAISSITQADPAVIQTTNVHNFTEGTPVTITDVNGMTQLNGNEYYMNIITGNTFSLYADPELTTTVDSTGFTTYTSGGVATGEYGGATKLNELSDAIANITDFPNSILIGHNTTGVLSGAARNTFIGLPGNSTSLGTFAAGQTITSGDDNTGIGAGALSKITTGSHNTAVGSAALGGPYSQTDFITHSYSTAVGGYAGWRSKSGNYNTLVGYSAGKEMETGSSNTAVGAISMQGMESGSHNTAVGYFALDNPEQGEDNVVIGARALLGGTATSPGPLRNIVIGRDAGFIITTATDNVLIGYTAGDAIATGSNNVIIGDYAGTATLADTVAIYAGSTERLTIDSTGATVNGLPIVTSSGGVTSANSISGAVTGHLIPDTNIAYDLGSATHKFRDLYLDGSSLHLGSTILRDDGSGNLQANLTNILEIAADDSTIRTINSGESIKFVGSGLVTTATDAEGNLTITGANPSGYNNTNWDDAHGWGNHASMSYLTSTGVLSSHTDVHTTAATDGQVLTWVNANSRWEPGGISGDMIGHIIPTTDAAYDFGSAEYKIRHLFLSSNSLWIGDDHKVNVEGGKQKFKKRKVGIVPTGVQTLLITSVFGDVAALKVSFKSIIHDPAPSNILNPDHAEFNPPTNKWIEFLASQGHFNKTVDDVYDNTSDFDSEGPDQGVTEGDIVYFDGTDYKRLAIGTAAQVLLANGSGTAPEWGDNDGGGASLTVADEGSALATSATTLDFVGAGVTVSGTGATKTVTIPGGGGGSGGAWILLDTTNVSAGSSSVDFTSSIITNTYTQYVIQITDLKPTTGQADLYCRMGNSSSFDSGGTDYYTRYHPNYASAAGIGLFDNSDKILMTNSADANGSINATIYLYSPSTATSETSINFQTAYTLNSNEVRHTFGAGARLEAAAHDMIQFYPSASTWASGTIKVYGIGTGSSGGGSGLDVADEGSDLTTTATKLDFVGAGVTASGTGVTKTITVPGGAFLEEFHIAGSGTSNGSSTITIPNNTARIEFDLVSGGGAQYDNTSTGPNGQGKTGTYTFTAGDLTALSGNSYQLTLQAGGYGGNENTGTAQPGKESWIRLNGTSIVEAQGCIGGRTGGGQTAYCNGTNVSPTGCIDKSHWIPTYGEGSPNRVVGFVRVKCYS